MTSFESRYPTTEAEFAEALGELLESARNNGIDLEGGYDYRFRWESTGWSVEVFRLAEEWVE
jgi:hypothetical protein